MKQKNILPLNNSYNRIKTSENESDKESNVLHCKIACILLFIFILTIITVLILIISKQAINNNNNNNLNILKTTIQSKLKCKKECWHNGTCEIIKINDIIENKCICKHV